MIPPFRLHRPQTVDEALAIADELGEEARFYAGGTELLLVMREGFLEPSHLIDLKGVTGLARIAWGEEDGSLTIGALATHTDIERSDLVANHLPELAKLTEGIANVRVRNTGTLGGNLCFGEPHGDPATLLIAADATLALRSTRGGRAVMLTEWIRGPFEVDLRPGELLESVIIPKTGGASRFAYRRLRLLERPSVGVAVRLDVAPDATISDARVVVGCVGPRPQRIELAEDRLRSAALVDLADAARAAGEAASRAADADGDAYGPADYKRDAVRILVERATLAVGYADGAQH